MTTGADKLETIRTYWGGIAEWEVCNRCSQNVDIKLWRYSGDLREDFWYTLPPFDAANEIELSNVGRHPALGGRIMGRLKDGATTDSRDYWVSWRVHGAGMWTDLEPRLEIEKSGLAWANSLVRWFTDRGGVQ